jgi:hypothetical protein
MSRNWRHNAVGLEDEKPREAQRVGINRTEAAVGRNSFISRASPIADCLAGFQFVVCYQENRQVNKKTEKRNDYPCECDSPSR